MKKLVVLKPYLLFAFICLILGVGTVSYAADNLKEMFANGSYNGEIRLLSFTRDFREGQSQDTVLGGTFYYKTDAYKGVSFGTAFGTTNTIADNDEDTFYYGLTASGHESVTRLQEYYVQGNWFDTLIKYGAQELDTPFLIRHDCRVIPRSYKGVSLVNSSLDNFTFTGIYLTEYQGWIDDDFVSFTNDVYIAGASYKLPFEKIDTNVEGWYFTMEDGYNQAYFKAKLNTKTQSADLYMTPIFFTQNSQGEELEGSSDSYQYGVVAGIKSSGFNLTGFYSKTGDDAIWDKWGYGKVIVQQVKNSGELADEDAFAARLAYDFGTLGIKGLSAYTFYANYDSPDLNVQETDFSIQYNFSGAWEGVGLRARYAYIARDHGENDTQDYRFYVTYKF